MKRFFEWVQDTLDQAEAAVRGAFSGFRTDRYETAYEPSAMAEYTDEARKALEDWQAAESYFNSIQDQDLVEYALYELEAARRKYEYLLRKIRRGDAAWERAGYRNTPARRLE